MAGGKQDAREASLGGWTEKSMRSLTCKVRASNFLRLSCHKGRASDQAARSHAALKSAIVSSRVAA